MSRGFCTKNARVLEIAARHDPHNVRIFGSVARGDATPGSDVDSLIDLESGRSLLDLGGLLMDLQDFRYRSGSRGVVVVDVRSYDAYARAKTLQELEDHSEALWPETERRQEFVNNVIERGSVTEFELDVKRLDGERSPNAGRYIERVREKRGLALSRIGVWVAVDQQHVNRIGARQHAPHVVGRQRVVWLQPKLHHRVARTRSN